MKVIFAIPTITGAVRAETTISLIEAAQFLWAKGIECDFHLISDCPDLEVARNTLAAMFRADPDATDHFWIDYDVKFPGEAVLKVLERPEDVVAGAYRVKVDNKTEFSVVPKVENGVPVGKESEDGTVLIDADFVATGFLRVKRHVYDKIAEAYPDLRYDDNVIKTVNRPIKEAWDFFAKRIRTTDGGIRRFTTEDYAFCQRWRDIGGKIWIYPNITFDHIGKKAYSGNMHEHFLTLPGGPIEKFNDIPGWMQPRELEWLMREAAKRDRIVEVGCWMGKTTSALAYATKGIVYAVDTWQGAAEHAEIMKAISPEKLFGAFQHYTQGSANILPIRKPSVEAAKELSDLDMVFIDAEHDYENVKADIQAWMEKLKPGGLLCGHDFEYSPGVKQAVSELLPGANLIYGTDIWAVTKPIKESSVEHENLSVCV